MRFCSYYNKVFIFQNWFNFFEKIKKFFIFMIWQAQLGLAFLF